MASDILPINTREELLAGLAPTAYWRVADLRITPLDTPGPWRHVVAWILGDTKEYALEGARRLWALVDGRKRYLWVAPEADSQLNVERDEWRHVGYVRFAFCNESGDEMHMVDLPPDVVYSGLPRLVV